ncbi:hypothetical protein KKB43_04785 [Patescibacteria group bacterium]|nr:hypothetical protein [Patescibacteria group bacterium]MBU4580304.1 hypothetical protein [Patescibacteria group bacterium]
MKKEQLSASMPKLIMTVSLIVCIGALLGAVGYAVKNKSVKIQQPQISPAMEPVASIEDEMKNWQIYSKPELDFTFKYPQGWNVIQDYFYETAAGIKASNPTIILQKIGDNNINDEIRINSRQFDCEHGKCAEVIDYMTVGTFSKNLEVLDVFGKIIKSFEKKDETADWQTCKNKKYSYEIKYPLDWKVWQPGAPEARLANCNENLSLVAFSPNIYAYPDQQQINIDVYDQDRLEGTVWEGITSLDDYLKITSVKIKKETVIDGERLVWRETADNQLIAFHNGSIYYFSVYNIDNSLLDQILSTFKFTTPEAM